MKEKEVEKFREGVERLKIILSDHPKFNSEVERIKKQSKIPINGFTPQEYNLWRHNNKDKYNESIEELNKLLLKITIPLIYRNFLHRFVFSKIFFNENELTKIPIKIPSSYEIKQGLSICDSSKIADKNTFFIQLNPWATQSDLIDAWKEIVKLRKLNDREKDNNKLFIPKIYEPYRQAWILKKKGLSDKEVHFILNKKRIKQSEDEIALMKKRYTENTLKKVMLF